MIRFVLKAISLFALVVAVMAGTIDAIQSVSASEPVLTPLAVAWSTASPETIALVADGVITATDAAANFDYEAPAPAETTAITFTAVALNAVQFKLTFDQAVNADDAVDEDFYDIDGKNVGNAALQADFHQN